MTSLPQIDYWRETNGGLRGSTMIRAGTVVMALAGLSNVIAPYVSSFGVVPYEPAMIAAWLSWILGLWILGAGFAWVGINPFLSRFGIVVGTFHIAQGVYLLVLLFTSARTAVPPVSLSVGRLVAILAFALIERESIGRSTSRLILVATGLALLKVAVRIMTYLPPLSATIWSLADAGMLILLAVTLLRLGTRVRILENSWAEERYRERSAGFVDFNNPEHLWNKADD